MKGAHETLAVTVDDPEDDGERADVVLGRRLPGVSRRVARTLGLRGRIYLDGTRIKPSTRVTTGARLELRVAPRQAAPAVTVLAQTARFVYVDKPAGLHTHRLRPDDPATLADAVAELHPECRAASPDPRQGGAVHRLDRHTTGVVAFARDLQAWREAREGFTSRRVLKLYRARVRTRPDALPWPPSRPGITAALDPAPSGPWPAPIDDGIVIAAPLGAMGRRRVAVREDGRPAITVAWPLPSPEGGPHELLLQLVTGRRHQARVHLAWIDRPIAGDGIYGDDPRTDLSLHALALDLGQACPGEPRVLAPLPDGWGAASAEPGADAGARRPRGDANADDDPDRG